MIDAAVDLCRRYGFEKTTVDQIAAIADVSPRTFSRYFATKEAVILALVDDAVDVAAEELENQPAELGHLDALFNAHLDMYRRVKAGDTGDLTPQRLMSTVQVVVSSPALLQATSDFRANAANLALARRMGVDVADRRLRLVATTWGAIVSTALGNLGPTTEWDDLTIDDVVAGVQATYADFIDIVAGVRRPV